jgi:hypothetical protein
VEAGPIAIRVGDLVIGVRTNDDEMTELLLGALRPHVEPGVDAPPNLSLKFGETDGRVRDLHFLYRSGLSVVRTDSRGRLLRGALRHLDGFTQDNPDATRVNAKLLVRDGDAMLVDGRFGGTVDVLGRRLDRLGYRIADVHAPLLDRETLEIRLQSSDLQMDADGLAEIDRRYPPTRQEVELQDGRYRLRGLVAWSVTEPHAQSPAQRYAELASLVTDRAGHISTDDFDVLARIPQSCEILRIPYPDARQLMKALRDLSSRASR